MGLLPREYYRLTPVEFGLMYAGYQEKERKTDRHIRRLTWTIVRGYADPKDMPKTMQQWWPIDKEDLEGIENSGVDINSWDEEKRRAAEETIRLITGG